MAVALRLVEPHPFRDQVEFDSDAAKAAVHSLHSGFGYQSPWPAAVSTYILKRFSDTGQLVVDPFCATGHLGLEAVLLGRRYAGSSHDSAFVQLAKGRLDPADIAEVALRLQLMNLKRPVDIRGFQRPFSLFFDVDTFCELVNLRSVLHGSADRVDRFIQHVIAGIIHGHTVAHLSGYTSPHVALGQDAQAELNRKRREVPSYRAVAPRVLRRAAMLLQDGVPSVLQRKESFVTCLSSDPRNLSHVSTGEAQLCVLAPEQPGFIENQLGSWLRSWWLGIDSKSESIQSFQNLEEWSLYCNELLFEAARITARNGRCVVRLGVGKIGARKASFKELLPQILQQGLGQYWRVEGTVVEHDLKSASNVKQVVGAGSAPTSRDGGSAELFVLRRK